MLNNCFDYYLISLKITKKIYIYILVYKIFFHIYYRLLFDRKIMKHMRIRFKGQEQQNLDLMIVFIKSTELIAFIYFSQHKD